MAEDYISKITLPTGEEFLVKDQTARQEIQLIKDSVVGVARYQGVVTAPSSTPIKDGATVTAGLTINGESYSPRNGDVIIVGTSGTGANAPKEFIFRETNSSTHAGVWNEFGSTGSLKALAFKDNATASYTPHGTITQPSFSGSPVTIESAYTPDGSISTPSFSGTTATVTVTSSEVSGSVTINTTDNGTVNYTPRGTITQPTFSGSQQTVGVNSGTGTSNYTPAGNVTSPTLHVTTTNADIYAIAKKIVSGESVPNVGSLPVLTTTVANENLTIGWNAGTLPVCETKSVADGIYEAYADAPSFKGTGTRLSVTFTPNGVISTPSFDGEGVVLQGTLDNNINITSTGTFRPAGSVSRPSFTGTASVATASYRPSGSITTPTFNGTPATITVS